MITHADLLAKRDQRIADLRAQVKPHMPFVYDDGGRAESGRKGRAGDCVCRAVAIATGIPYEDMYKRLAHGTGNERRTKNRANIGRTASAGILTNRKWFKDLMASLGFIWVPCMAIGTGAKMSDHMTFGGLHAYHQSRKIRRQDFTFAALIFEAIRKADSGNFARLKRAFPELVEEMTRRYSADLGVLPEDRVEDMNALAEQIERMMA